MDKLHTRIHIGFDTSLGVLLLSTNEFAHRLPLCTPSNAWEDAFLHTQSDGRTEMRLVEVLALGHGVGSHRTRLAGPRTFDSSSWTMMGCLFDVMGGRGIDT